MIEGQPFVGMTREEADLALTLLEESVELDKRVLRAVYVGGKGERYYVDFSGDPPKVAFWSSFEADDIKLTDPKDLRPEPPIPIR